MCLIDFPAQAYLPFDANSVLSGEERPWHSIDILLGSRVRVSHIASFVRPDTQRDQTHPPLPFPTPVPHSLLPIIQIRAPFPSPHLTTLVVYDTCRPGRAHECVIVHPHPRPPLSTRHSFWGGPARDGPWSLCPPPLPPSLIPLPVLCKNGEQLLVRKLDTG